jgi:hypothetical protein
MFDVARYLCENTVIMAGESSEFELRISGIDFQLGHDELTLYTFAGSFALYDHVYVGFVDHKEAAYIFKTDPEQAETYALLRGYIAEHALPMVLNWKEPVEADIRAYNNNVATVAAEFPDFFIED